MVMTTVVPIATAAAMTGVSGRTLRRWIANGQLLATGGKRDRLVDLEAVRRLAATASGRGSPGSALASGHFLSQDMAIDGQSGQRNGQQNGQTNGQEVPFVAAILEQNKQLHQENIELAGRVGWLMAQLESAKEQIATANKRILELEAPKGQESGGDQSAYPE